MKFGIFLSLHGVLYGISKFANGFSRRSCKCPHVLVSALICIRAELNVVFGYGYDPVCARCHLDGSNGWVQGMGFPPCARLMANWFFAKQTRRLQFSNLELFS